MICYVYVLYLSFVYDYRNLLNFLNLMELYIMPYTARLCKLALFSANILSV